MKTLGEFKSIDVRKVWKNEAANFTPWLAQEENISLLGKALGLELEVETVEAAVGPYSADILAKDTGRDTYVVIENQLEKTDHDHLGKAITYGSVLQASAIVWIARTFTEEHQRALDWLNENTTEDLAFYGVQLEVWQIDNSLPAVRFEVVCRPAVIKKKAAGDTGELSDAKKLQFDFWTAFREKLIEEGVVPNPQTPRPQYWFNVSLGKSGIYLSCTANTYEGKIGVRVYMQSKVAESALSQLLPQREEIEKELGLSLEWDPNKDAQDKVIATYKDANLQDQTQWDADLGWLVNTVARFQTAFRPRIKKLKF